MADTKISGLGALTTFAGDDELVVVDKSDTTMAASGTTKRVEQRALVAPMPGVWQPAMQNYKAWSVDPLLLTTNGAVYGDGLILARVPVPASFTVGSLTWELIAAGSGWTAAQDNCFVVYSKAGVLLGKSADQTANWGSTGVKTATITAEAGQSLSIVGAPDQWILIGVCVNASSPPNARRGAAAGGAVNLGMSNTVDGIGMRYYYFQLQHTVPANIQSLWSGFNAYVIADSPTWFAVS